MSLDKKKSDTWQTYFAETSGGFCLLLRHPLYSGILYLWSNMMLYVVIKIIIKTLNIVMFKFPQDLKCVEKMVYGTDTDEVITRYSRGYMAL